MDPIQVKIKRLHPLAIMPRYQTAGAACFDLHAIDAGNINFIRPGIVSTGLAVEVPEGHVMLIYSRSGHGFNKNVRLANCVGVLDSDFRGEVKVKLAHDEYERAGSYGAGFSWNAGERIAQAMIVKLPQVELVEVEELSETERGVGGFGSTGT